MADDPSNRTEHTSGSSGGRWATRMAELRAGASGKASKTDYSNHPLFKDLLRLADTVATAQTEFEERESRASRPASNTADRADK